MAEMIPGEPQSAADYDDRTTTAVKTVLIEIGHSRELQRKIRYCWRRRTVATARQRGHATRRHTRRGPWLGRGGFG